MNSTGAKFADPRCANVRDAAIGRRQHDREGFTVANGPSGYGQGGLKVQVAWSGVLQYSDNDGRRSGS